MDSTTPGVETPGTSNGGLPPIAPDFVEQDWPDEIDNIVPTRGYHMTPVVGIGGSAGGITALTEFLRLMPPDSGIAFVVVLHLSPSHESALAELLSSVTSMQVVQARDGQKVEANHVYVIPPGKFMAAVQGRLKLTPIEHDRGRRVAVDLFFRSLADTYGSHAAAIVVSGADGDGALGIRRIKERGGLTIAQDPDEAEHTGMPRSAVETGMVDWVLRIAEMPGRLLKYRDNELRLRLPPEDGPAPILQTPNLMDAGEAALRDVLIYLRTRTGRDFTVYKRATILRRIARRMQVNSVDDLISYLNFLRTHPGEAGALLQDLLISVTNFFRDREVFTALADHIPELFAGKGPADSVRVWVPACATGEEAYSMAIMLLEHARTLDAPPALQVFACDLNDDAIQIARAGHYSDALVADVSEDRLRLFFAKDAKGYRVRRELREMVLFASHDLLEDAPFSRMDLISCRNLLIYLNRDAQQRVLDTFHFAMKPGGRLLLGSSEAVDEGSTMFRVLNKKHRIYQHQPAVRPGLPLPADPGSAFRSFSAHPLSPVSPVVHGRQFAQSVTARPLNITTPELDKATLAELHFRLIERVAPPSVLVNRDYDILHLSEHAGDFLKFSGGEPTANLLRVVLPALRIDLRTALFRAAESGARVETRDIRVELQGELHRVHIRVEPASDVSDGYMLITFERQPADEAGQSSQTPDASSEPTVRHLERELEHVKSNLRSTVEQYEASTEELKASNEELQAMNEELRSATEELETSREELQSINEELTTVNLEIKGKMEEVASANSDLQNLMASTSIATVFLDRDMVITRYTPSAAAIFNLIPGDIGRPLAHLKHQLSYPDLMTDAATVLRTLVPIEHEVQDGEHWYLARLQPYRTMEDHIAGVVLTLVDVTEQNRAIDALRKSEERLRLLMAADDHAQAIVKCEGDIQELRREVNALCEQLGQPPRYPAASE